VTPKAQVRWREDGRWVDAATAKRPYTPPPGVRAAVCRTLDAIARRRLEEVDDHPVGLGAHGVDGDTLDGVTDE
jgi:hypothetical protein